MLYDEKVIRENDYVPSSVARTLKSRKSGIITVIVHTLRYQVGAQTVTGINEVCNRYGYGTMVCCSENDPAKELQAIQLCLNQQVEGFVIVPAVEPIEPYQAICEKGTPVVLCTRNLPGWPYGSVYVRHDELIEKMMLHLKEQGFERVQLFQDEDTFHKRRMGQVFVRSAAKLFGMNETEAIAMVGRTETRVPEAIDALLHGEPERKKAVFAINTHTLFLVLRELEHRKVRIPDDLGVCGYDALGWSELVYPGISSIYQPMRQMGVQAREKIIEALQMER